MRAKRLAMGLDQFKGSNYMHICLDSLTPTGQLLALRNQLGQQLRIESGIHRSAADQRAVQRRGALVVAVAAIAHMTAAAAAVVAVLPVVVPFHRALASHVLRPHVAAAAAIRAAHRLAARASNGARVAGHLWPLVSPSHSAGFDCICISAAIRKVK